jgi:hypothetical protein
MFSSPERMAMLSLPIAFTSAIGVFAPVFSRPVWQHVKVLMTGAVLARNRSGDENRTHAAACAF